MKKIYFIFLICVTLSCHPLSLLGQAPPEPIACPLSKYQIVPEASFVRFQFETWFLGSVKGSFESFTYEACVSPEEPLASQAYAEIHMNSITNDSSIIPDFLLRQTLDVSNYPTTTLKTLDIRPTQIFDVYELDLEMVFRGKPSLQTIQAQLFLDGEEVHFRGTPHILVEPEGIVVQVFLDLVLQKAPTGLEVF